jgi:hypothetical protein
VKASGKSESSLSLSGRLSLEYGSWQIASEDDCEGHLMTFWMDLNWTDMCLGNTREQKRTRKSQQRHVPRPERPVLPALLLQTSRPAATGAFLSFPIHLFHRPVSVLPPPAGARAVLVISTKVTTVMSRISFVCPDCAAEEDDPSLTLDPDQTQGQKLSKQGQHPLSSQAGSIHSSLSSQPVWNQSSYNHIISQDGFNQSTRSNLSPYLTPLSLELGEDDFQYLTAKGALNLPAPWLLNQLMRSYQNYIHPALPVLDFQSISEIVKRGDGSNGQISLLLHHALMYAASSYVSTEQWRAAGYVSKKDARADFLEKAKVITKKLILA